MPASCKALATTASPERALVIQLARLGDFLQTTPLLAALDRQGLAVEVLVTPAQAPLARACGVVDKVHILDPVTLERAAGDPGQPWALGRARMRGLLEPLAELAPDQVFNLNLSRLCAALACLWPPAGRHGWRLDAGSGQVRGEPWSPFMLHLVAQRRLTRLHLCDILASYAGQPGPPLVRLDQSRAPRPDLLSRQGLPRPRVVLQLGAQNDLRRWPLAAFAHLAGGLLAQGVAVALTGSASERVLGRRLRRELGPAGDQVCDLMGATDLEGLAGVLAGADLVVACDTGTLHLATAVGIPVLGLYMGPAQAHETGPYGPGHLVLQARDACGPCQEHNPPCQGKAPCRGLIPAPAVLAACLALLAGSDAPAAASGLDLPPGVEPLVGVQDSFGQRYARLRPGALDQEKALALALRAAGRQLLRPNHAWNQDDLARELAQEYESPLAGERAGLDWAAQAAGRLARAAADQDQDTAAETGRALPALAPLARLVGPAAPPGLVRACAAAREVLEMAAAGGPTLAPALAPAENEIQAAP